MTAWWVSCASAVRGATGTVKLGLSGAHRTAQMMAGSDRASSRNATRAAIRRISVIGGSLASSSAPTLVTSERAGYRRQIHWIWRRDPVRQRTWPTGSRPNIRAMPCSCPAKCRSKSAPNAHVIGCGRGLSGARIALQVALWWWWRARPTEDALDLFKAAVPFQLPRAAGGFPISKAGSSRC